MTLRVRPVRSIVIRYFGPVHAVDTIDQPTFAFPNLNRDKDGQRRRESGVPALGGDEDARIDQRSQGEVRSSALARRSRMPDQTLGCVTHKSRGPAICTNDKTISERKVRAAVVGHLRNVLTRPDRIEAFIDEFQRRYRELLDTSGTKIKSIDAQIARQRQQIEAVMTALVTVPGSKALGARLAIEEAKLPQLEAERAALTDQRPKVMPHPALIARYVEDLLTTLDTDVPKARAILMRTLRPFKLTPDGASYRISGALNLSAVVGSGVSEKSSSGGARPFPS